MCTFTLQLGNSCNSYIDSHTDGSGCHTRFRPAHQMQLDSVFCQSTLPHVDQGNWTSDLMIRWRWLYSWATVAQGHIGILHYMLITSINWSTITTTHFFFLHFMVFSFSLLFFIISPEFHIKISTSQLQMDVLVRSKAFSLVNIFLALACEHS